MFEKLDNIDWAALNHAYGSAADVPELLRDLNSDDDDIRGNAFYTAYGNIFHQGTRYQATAPTVPFLIEILDREEYAAKDELMYLMAHLIMGYDEYYLPFGFRGAIAKMRHDLAELKAAPAEPPDEEEEGGEWESDEDWLSWLVDITDETRRGEPRYIRLLGSDDERVRVAASFLLSWLPEDFDLFAPSLWELAQNDPEDTVRANALIALALAADDEAFVADYADAVAGLLRAGEPIVQFAAAVALGTRCFEDAPDGVVQVLLDAVARAGASTEEESDASDDWYIAWYGGEYGTYATDVLAIVSRDEPQRVLRAVGDALGGMDTIQAANAATTMIAMLFPEGFQGDDAEDLDQMGYEFLEVLARVRNPWFLGDASFANFTMMMGEFGLPDSQEKLEKFLSS